MFVDHLMVRQAHHERNEDIRCLHDLGKVSIVGRNPKGICESLKRTGYGSGPAEVEAILFCHGKLAVYKLPREVEFVDRMPRATGPGKLLRRLLRQREQDKAQVRGKP